MDNANGNIPFEAAISLHNELSPVITKLEFLSRLAPFLDTDAAYGDAVLLINDMMGDYTDHLRRRLFASEGPHNRICQHCQSTDEWRSLTTGSVSLRGWDH